MKIFSQISPLDLNCLDIEREDPSIELDSTEYYLIPCAIMPKGRYINLTQDKHKKLRTFKDYPLLYAVEKHKGICCLKRAYDYLRSLADTCKNYHYVGLSYRKYVFPENDGYEYTHDSYFQDKPATIYYHIRSTDCSDWIYRPFTTMYCRTNKKILHPLNEPQVLTFKELVEAYQRYLKFLAVTFEAPPDTFNDFPFVIVDKPSRKRKEPPKKYSVYDSDGTLRFSHIDVDDEKYLERKLKYDKDKLLKDLFGDD